MNASDPTAGPRPDPSGSEPRPGPFEATREELAAAAAAASAELRVAGLALVAMAVLALLVVLALATGWIMAVSAAGLVLTGRGVPAEAVLLGFSLAHVALAWTLWSALRRASRQLRLGRFLRER